MGRLVVLVVAAMWVAACGATPGEGDEPSSGSVAEMQEGDAGAALPPGSRMLELESKSPLQLGFASEVRIDVRLRDAEGGAVEGERVSFALIGRAPDASLASLDATTDAEGRVDNLLKVGNSLSTFRVRISASGAEDDFVQVSVGDGGFGTLLVDATYDGPRVVRKRVVTVVAGMSCEGAMRTGGDPMVTLDSSDADQPARFGSLPAGTSYAVMAVAEGPTQETVVASACHDGVMVEAGEQQHVEVEYVDAPLSANGRFAVRLELSAGEPAESLATAFEQAARDLVQSDADGAYAPQEAEARFLLDSLVGALQSEELAATPLPELAEAVIAAKTNEQRDPSLLSSLSSALQEAEVGPLPAIERTAELVAQALSTTRVASELEVSPSQAEQALSLHWHALRMEAQAPAGASGPLSIDLVQLAEDGVIEPQDGAPTEGHVEPGDDRLVFEDARLRVVFGTLAIGALNNTISKGRGGAGEEIRQLLGCAELAAWLDAQALHVASCGEACQSALCERALARIVGAAEGGLRPLDETRPTIELAGALRLQDEDGDLSAEALQAVELRGSWKASDPEQAGDAVSGAADGLVVVE